MIRELLTLMVDDIPTCYYIKFTIERRQFSFQPTLKHKSAPFFVLWVKDEEIISENDLDSRILEQAKEKIKEILSNSIFDEL